MLKQELAYFAVDFLEMDLYHVFSAGALKCRGFTSEPVNDTIWTTIHVCVGVWVYVQIYMCGRVCVCMYIFTTVG